MPYPARLKLGTPTTRGLRSLSRQARSGAQEPPVEVSDEFEASLSAQQGSGNPLSNSTQWLFESFLGSDLTGVRVHVGGPAAQLAESLDARAFAYGNDIFFAQGEYSPSSSEGKHLLAHELAHVVQQMGNSRQCLQRQVYYQEEHPYRVKEGAGEIDFGAIAETLYLLLLTPEPDEDVMTTLEPFRGEPGNIRRLKDAYKHRVNSDDDAALENDLRASLSEQGLEDTSALLYGPQKVTLGIASGLLAEAEQNTKPGGACSVESLKRYVRAYLDYYHLDGQLRATEQIRKETPGSSQYLSAKAKLRIELDDLLGEKWGEKYLDGGPNGTKVQKVNALIGALEQPALFASHDRALATNALWQVYKQTTEYLPGATKALEKLELAKRLKLPWSQEGSDQYNIKRILWDEVLKPGAIVQTYRNTTSTSGGHSFIFVEYVYSPQEAPPKGNRDAWELYGATGTPLNREGIVVSARPSLTEMRNLHLVGMRIIDQYGYKFLAKEGTYTKPGQGRQGLAKSEVWYASNLVEKDMMEFDTLYIQGSKPRTGPIPVDVRGVLSKRHRRLRDRPRIPAENVEEYGLGQTIKQQWERMTSSQGVSASLADYKDRWVHAHRHIIKEAAWEYEIPDWVLGGVAWTEVGGEPSWTDDLSYILGDLGIRGRKELASFGPVAIQIGRAAEELGYDATKLLDLQMSFIIQSLEDPQQNLLIVASHLHRCKNVDSPAKPPDMLTADDIRIIGARYNRGVNLSREAILTRGPKTQYGDDLLKKQWRIRRLLGE